MKHRRKNSGLGVAMGMWAGLAALLVGALLAGTASLVSSAGRQGGPAPASGVPAVYQTDAIRAGIRFGVPWEVVAAIYRVECDFGTSPLAGCNPAGTENPFGAQGPGQFLPATWRRGLGPFEVIPAGPPTASVAAGYATDGNGDGVADPWDPADATASTARLLAANGGVRSIRRAVYAYNHSAAYVGEVLQLAATYRRASLASETASSDPGSSSSGSSGPVSSSPAAVVVSYLVDQLGAPYQWGGAGPRRYDCSGLVMAAYRRVGVDLPHDAALQYADTQATSVPLDQLRAGDIVFFGPSPAGIHHDGVYVGDGQMIDAPHTGAVVRVESIGWPDLLAATRPLP